MIIDFFGRTYSVMEKFANSIEQISKDFKRYVDVLEKEKK